MEFRHCKGEITAELKKLDDLIAFYEGESQNTKNQAAGTATPRRNGNTRHIVKIARKMIKEKGGAVATTEIAERLKKDGFSADYSRGMNIQISGYLSRMKEEFESTPEGWILKNNAGSDNIVSFLG